MEGIFARASGNRHGRSALCVLARRIVGIAGRPIANLYEALVQINLARNAPAEALRIADLLAQEFPRRPSAWYLRAEALRVNDRDLKRRARCPVWQSARRPMIRLAWARGSGWRQFSQTWVKNQSLCHDGKNIRAVAGGPKLAEGNRCISDACRMGAAGAGLRAGLVPEMGASAGNGACR